VQRHRRIEICSNGKPAVRATLDTLAGDLDRGAGNRPSAVIGNAPIDCLKRFLPARNGSEQAEEE
jgi:hypothetical protein